jgi:type IV secretory pathway VirB3-like protein
MTPEDEPLEDVPLRVARTRPAMRFGIPFVYIVPVGVICLEINAIFGLWPAIYVDPSLIIALIVIVRNDHNAFRLWGIWLQTKAIILDGWYYGGACVSPFPVRTKADRPRGVPSDAW